MMLLVTTALAAQVELPERFTEGEPIELAVQGASSLEVTYRPGTVVPEKETLPIENGRLTWTPLHPGVVELAFVEGDERDVRKVSVRFGSIPVGGVLVFLFAGGVLFGGAAWAFRRLMQGRDEGLEVGSAPLDL